MEDLTWDTYMFEHVLLEEEIAMRESESKQNQQQAEDYINDDLNHTIEQYQNGQDEILQLQLQLHIDYVNYLIQQHEIEEDEIRDNIDQQHLTDHMKYEEEYIAYLVQQYNYVKGSNK